MTARERVIALDTETTGLSHPKGDRIVEIGAVELYGNMETGRTWHRYVNPYPREVDPEALAIHGLSNEFLMDKPKFREIAEDFLSFVGDSPLVIHNAPFDTGFLNCELERTGRKPLQNEIRDSLKIARNMFPGQRSSLDALCDRFGVDNSGRELHGALIDASLLAQVYVSLMGLDRLDLTAADQHEPQTPAALAQVQGRRPRPYRHFLAPTEAETNAHAAFIANAVKDAIWARA